MPEVSTVIIVKSEAEILLDLGSSMYVAKVKIEDIREQDENARLMDTAMFSQLAANIKRRGVLESLPLCAETEKGIEMVSGHHRARAAKAAGMVHIPVLLDRSGLTRSAIIAKQLAHNNIAGFDDHDMLKRLAQKINGVDYLLEAFLPKTLNFEPPAVELGKLMTPRVTFDWKAVTLLFLPHQMTEFKELIDDLPGTHDMVGVVPVEQFEAFAREAAKFARFKNVISIGMAVAMLTGLARDIVRQGIPLDELIDASGDAKSANWVEVGLVVGHDALPPEAAATVRKALDRMVAKGMITKKDTWRALEIWAEAWLAAEREGA